MTPNISVVIPAHNEELSVPALVSAINRFIETIDFSIQFIIVDDGSTDNTLQTIINSTINCAEVKIVKLSRNFGAHAAIRAGIKNADAKYVFIYSMDMPEPIEDIALFYHELQAGTEIVFSKRMGYRGSLGSRIFSYFAKRFILPDFPTEGLIGVAFGPKVKQYLNDNIEDNTSFFFQLFSLGFSKKSFDVKYIERISGSSSWTFAKRFKLMIDCFVMFSFAPIRTISVLGFIMAVLGFIWAAVLIVIKIFGWFEFSAGWPTIISILLIGFGITNISLGIISEYLVRTLEAARKRPVFIIDDVIYRTFH
jgi:dolichol-phosphate mannosyltransferase